MNLILMNCKVISQSNTFKITFNLLYIEIKIFSEFESKNGQVAFCPICGYF